MAQANANSGTENRLALRTLQSSRKCNDTNTSVNIYTLVDRTALKTGDVAKYQIGAPRLSGLRERTILIVGETGTGKTTFINSMANYLFDVHLDDDFRFKIVTQEEEGAERVTSITEKVTAYKFGETRLPYSLTVVDTPGYGDTKGLKADKNTTRLIKDLFATEGEQGVDRLDAVCLVVKASETRLTPTQRYNFDSVLSLFGWDMTNNIFIVATFADGAEPPVKLALEEACVPYEKLYTFNNSAFFQGRQTGWARKTQELYWEMGNDSFDKFFQGLDTIVPKSLTLSTKVLQRRAELEANVEELRKEILEGVDALETMRKDSIELEKIDAVIEASQHFESTVTTRMEFLGINMGKKTSYIVNDALKAKYTSAKSERGSKQALLNDLAEKFGAKHKQIFNLVKDMRSALEELGQIAMRKNNLTDVRYLELLIHTEETEAKPGWQARVQHLHAQMAIAEQVAATQDPNFDPFSGYKSQDWLKYIEQNLWQ